MQPLLKNHRDASVRPLALDLSPAQGGMVPWTGGGGVPAANSLTLVCSASADMIFVVLVDCTDAGQHIIMAALNLGTKFFLNHEKLDLNK